MLTLQQIEGIINDNNSEKIKKDKLKPKWVQVYYGMSLHIDGVCPSFMDTRQNVAIYPPGWVSVEYDVLFDTYYLNKYVTESELTRNWRKIVYRPFTRAPFLQCISVITGAIFQDSSYSIIIQNKEDKDYIWSNSFGGKDFIQYISSSFQYISEDPNGLFVVIPKEPYYQTTTARVEPDIWFVFSKDVIHKSEDEVIFRRDELIWVVTRNSIFRYHKPKGTKYVNMDGANVGYFGHNLGFVPAFVAGGVWNTQGYFDSWFVNAKPIADEYISSYSSLQHINKDATHPYVQEADVQCPACRGVPKMQFCKRCNCNANECLCGGDHTHWELENCSKCGGTGSISRNPGDRIVAPVKDMDKELVKIINRDVDANKYLFEFDKDLYNQIYRALFLNYIEQAQSGVAKDKDMEARYQYLSKISNDLFDRLIYGLLTVILGYRNVVTVEGELRPDVNGLTIVKPTHFQIQTAYELLEEYKVMGDSKMPPYQRGALLEKYNDKQYSGDDLLNKKGYVINNMDILNVLTQEEISAAILYGGATARDLQLHLRLPAILNRVIREKGSEWFMRADYTNIETEALSAFDILLPPPIPINPFNEP